MNPYSKLVSDFARLVAEGKTLPLGGFPPTAHPPRSPDAPTALFFAPHPDDETILGGLALRLMRESKWNVINIAITLGSIKGRKAGRAQELHNACQFLGFGLELSAPEGLDDVKPTTRGHNPEAWSRMVAIVASTLEKHRPQVIFFPHDQDWNSTHVGVHFLVVDALKAAPGVQCFLVETEFWGQMQTPNLLVEYNAETVADLMAATSFHVGEVQRNPYHILFPAWLLDNVRLGAELVGGQGGAAPSFLFAQLFRLRRWTGSQIENCYVGGRFLKTSENPADLFKL